MKGAVRLIAWCLAIALVALPIVGVLRGWFAAGRWPVTQLTVQAEFKHVSADDIRAAVRPRLGKGFFALDLDAVQRAVAALPWVESVEARKRWPDTLQLRIYERQPFARWNDKRLISRQGLVFDAPGMADIGTLPDLRGPDARLAEVVSFYAETRKAFAGTHLQITGVALTERGSWSVSTANGAQIVIGDREQAGRRLRRFLDVYPQLIVGHTDGFAYADLRYTNGFAVRWPQAPAANQGGSPRS
ncbi:cell division protein FtsQ [Rhodanobacter sp. FW510-R12]|uniref:cell division protein FtsQ/DivIB n=1 Tax=unclassified Rhodanobacter TaxID=2621553 RepID=UPI0007A9D137|nr:MULTISPECIES: cell division protein FtsQ/DivIB [unclassified Rhodanobacter]KZC17247.1 cell division protein FtsQ [Rhodanobacter sp. FW104-R8]KZC29103.1 cell division protein FtsQ [Rhodanobacter sp. FW510-T8]KZC33041.1 cell division protein FtsQ [Rhodanobacter sp. FW510-R10]